MKLRFKGVQNKTFKTKNGVIFEEIATTYLKGDSIYLDGDIPTDGRKTIINLD